MMLKAWGEGIGMDSVLACYGAQELGASWPSTWRVWAACPDLSSCIWVKTCSFLLLVSVIHCPVLATASQTEKTGILKVLGSHFLHSVTFIWIFLFFKPLGPRGLQEQWTSFPRTDFFDFQKLTLFFLSFFFFLNVFNCSLSSKLP